MKICELCGDKRNGDWLKHIEYTTKEEEREYMRVMVASKGMERATSIVIGHWLFIITWSSIKIRIRNINKINFQTKTRAPTATKALYIFISTNSFKVREQQIMKKSLKKKIKKTETRWNRQTNTPYIKGRYKWIQKGGESWIIHSITNKYKL